MLDTLSSEAEAWRLRGTAMQVAVYVAAGFVAAALLVTAIDYSTDFRPDSSLIQAWTLVPQVVVVLGLVYIGYVRSSRTFWVLGALVALVLIEEAFHVLNPVEVSMRGLVGRISEGTGVDRAIVNGMAVYGLVALIGLGFLAYSLLKGSRSERKVVRNIAVLLAIGWFFGGPVSVLSRSDDGRLLAFIEEVGEAVVFALLAGYVSGLVYAAAGHRIRRPARQDFG